MQLTKVQQRIVDILRENPEGCPLGALELKLEGETLPTLMDSLNALKAKNVIAYGAYGVHLDSSYVAASTKRPSESAPADPVPTRKTVAAQQRDGGACGEVIAAATRKEAGTATRKEAGAVTRKKVAVTLPAETSPASHTAKRASTPSVTRSSDGNYAGMPRRGIALCDRSPITLLDLTESQRSRLAQLQVDTVGALVALLGQKPRSAELGKEERDAVLQALLDVARKVSYIRAHLYLDQLGLDQLGEIGPNGLFFNAFGALCVLVGAPRGYVPKRQIDVISHGESSLSAMVDAVLWNWALPCEGRRRKALVSAIAMYMRDARDYRSLSLDQSDSSIVERALAEYLGSRQLVYSCAALAYAWHEECAMRYKADAGLPGSLRVAPNTYWKHALAVLRRVCGTDFSVSADGKSVRFFPKTLDAWLHSMTDSTRRIVLMSLLRGDSLDAIEDTVGVAQRELKKIIHEEFAKAPVLMEDRLLARVKDEHPSFKELSAQTRADVRVNLYLYLRYVSGLGSFQSSSDENHPIAKGGRSNDVVQAPVAVKGSGSVQAKAVPIVEAEPKKCLKKAPEATPQKLRAPVVMVEERAEEWSHQQSTSATESLIPCIEDVAFAGQEFEETPLPVTRDSALATLGLTEDSVYALEREGVCNVGSLFEILRKKDARIGPRARHDLLKALKGAAFPVPAVKAVPFLTARGKRRPGGFYFSAFGLLCVAPPAPPSPSPHEDVDPRAPILISKLGSQAIGVIGTSSKISNKLWAGGIFCVSDLYGRDEHQLASACGISLDDASEVLRLFDAYLSENDCMIPSIAEKDQLQECRKRLLEIAPERLNVLDSAISHLKLDCSDDDLRCLYSVLLPEVRRLLLSAEEDHESNPSIWLNVLVNWCGERQLAQTCLAKMENWRTSCLIAEAQGETVPEFCMADVPFWQAASNEFSHRHEGEIAIAGHRLLFCPSADARATKSPVEADGNDSVLVAQMFVDALACVVRSRSQAGKNEPGLALDGHVTEIQAGEGDASISYDQATSSCVVGEEDKDSASVSESIPAAPVRSRFSRLLSAVFHRKASAKSEETAVGASAERAQTIVVDESDGAREAREREAREREAREREAREREAREREARRDHSGTAVVRTPDGAWRVLDKQVEFIMQGGQDHQAYSTESARELSRAERERELRRAARAQALELASEERTRDIEQALLHERELRKGANARSSARGVAKGASNTVQVRSHASRREEGDSVFDAGHRDEAPSAARVHSKNATVRLEDTPTCFSTPEGLVPRNRDAVLVHLLRERGESMRIEELVKRYEDFLADHGISPNDTYLQLPGARKLAMALRRSGGILMMRQSTVRYYDWSAVDFSRLDAALREMSKENIECSISLFMRRYPDVTESVGARDEDELYAIARERCSKRRHGLRITAVPDVSFPKIPIVIFGNGNRERQVLGLIEEMSPVQANELAEEYERRYGVRSATVKSSFLKDFRQYRVNGRYELYAGALTAEESHFVEDAVQGNAYTPLGFVRKRFEGAFIGSTSRKLNDANLSALGYGISENLIVRSGVNLRREFSNLIERNGKFSRGDEGFPIEVMEHSLFRSEEARRMRELGIIEYESGSFVSAEYLRSHYGVTVSDMRDFVEAVTSYVPDEMPFTIKNLLDEGFTHRVMVLKVTGEFGTGILSSIFAQARDGMRVHNTTYGGVTIFCKSVEPFSASKLVRKTVECEGEMELEDLADQLKSKFGVEVTNSALRQLVDRSGLFVATALDETIFLDREAYSAYVKDMLDS